MNQLTVRNKSELQATRFSAELFTRWVNFIDASPKTVETYTRAIKQFFSYLSDSGVTQPTRETIISYRDFLSDSGKQPTTIQNYIMAVKQFFNWTEQEGYYPNVAKHVKGAKLDTEHKKDYLTAHQISVILGNIDTESLKGLRDYAILTLMVTAGLRTIEVARANVEDLRTRGNFTALYLQGKGHSERSQFVKVVPEVEEAIRAYLSARGPVKKGDPLFTSISNRNTNERMTTRSISRLVKDSFIQAGYDSEMLTAHSLRHTTATLNLLAGGSVEETKQLLRHTNINTTLIYSHALERDTNDSEYRVAGTIFNRT